MTIECVEVVIRPYDVIALSLWSLLEGGYPLGGFYRLSILGESHFLKGPLSQAGLAYMLWIYNAT